MAIASLIYLVVSQLVIPASFIVALWRGRDRDRLNLLLKALYSGAYLALIGLIGRWDWLSYYLLPILGVLFLATLVGALRRARTLPWLDRDGVKGWLRVGSGALALAFFLAILGFAGKGLFYTDDAVQLAFPLRDGRYYVGQGGNSSLVNYHNASRSQRYALDVVALNAAGSRARGLAPGTLADYAIFGATVHSPCAGTILTAVGDRPDLIPPDTDREQLAGNHVVIACEGVKVLIAHLQAGSLAVQAGASVAVGQPLGRVGNSGNTSEPHLHIHAVRGSDEDVLRGTGVPIVFDGTFATRNRLFLR